MRFFLYSAIALAGPVFAGAQAQQHPFTVKDDIAMTRISDPRANPAIPGSEVAWPSPDGRYAAIVTSKGILETDQIESRILIFDLHKIAQFLMGLDHLKPEPRVIASIRSYPHHLETDAYAPVIKDVRWARDSARVYFLAENTEGNYQLCTATVQANNFRCITPENKSVDFFDVGNRSIAFSAADPGEHLIDPGKVINQDAVDLTGARLQEILFPDDIASRASELFHLYTVNVHKDSASIHTVPKY